MSSLSAMTRAASARPTKSRVPLFTPDAWAPLKVELFRALWIATSVAQIGTWAREAAGPWLMHLMTQGAPNHAAMVAKVTTFSNLPICLFSVFAGALADVLDRRQLLIVTQIWMVVVSIVLGLLAYFGWINAWGLLGLTFLLGVGTAAFGPALQAVLPELVPRQHFALAINMNSVALNVARALGPGLFILVIYFVHGGKGVGISYLLTGISFVWSVWVLYRWQRPPQRAAIHGEEMWGAIRAGFWYTVYSPANRAILLRVLAFIVPALVMWSQVPIIATKQLNMGETSYALLFAFVGIGAVLGVFLMPGLHGRYKIDPVVNVCTALFALGLIALSYSHSLWTAAFIMMFLGVNWVIIPTNFNTATQKSVPLWVKGRAISFYLTVLFGSFALGAAIWGRVTTHTSIHTSLLLGGISMLALLVLSYWFPLTINEGKDLSAAYAGVPDDLLGAKPPGTGPIQIGARYRIPTHRKEGFSELLEDIRRMRLRNGAQHWRLDESPLGNGHTELAEIIIFSSWQEYARSFSRATRWDLMLGSLAREYLMANDPPAQVQRGFPVGAPQSAVTALAGAIAAPAISAPPTRLTRLPARERISHALDRIIDEIFVAYDRLNAPRSRVVVWRNVMLVVPASARHGSRAPASRSSGPGKPRRDQTSA